MSALARLIQIELFKLLKHRLTWVLLVALLLVLGLRLRDQYIKARDGVEIDRPAANMGQPWLSTPTQDDYDRAAVLPGIFECLYRSYDWLIIALILLDIVAVGNEFSWGTMRTLLARGVPRGRLVLAKWGASAIVVTGFLLTLWLLCGLFGLWSTHKLTGNVNWVDLDGSVWREQMILLARTWIVTLLLIAFILAVYIWAGKPGPAFALLFLLFFSSLLAYALLSVGMTALFAIPDFDPQAFGRTIWAQSALLVPHYNIRSVIYWKNPPVLAELDQWAKNIAGILAMPSNPWILLAVLACYGLIPLPGAIWRFKRQEIMP